MTENRKRINEIDQQIAELKKTKEHFEKEDSRLHTNDKVNDFLQRYSGKELIKKFSLAEYGTWEVRGEDPNCDMGGSHVTPLLGYFKGKLEDVLIHAVNLKGFWAWGAGGEVKKIEPIVITKL